MMGGLTADYLLNKFVERVEADGGEVADKPFIKSFYQMVLDSGAYNYCKKHAIILFPEARRLTSGNVNKMYSLFDADYDATQTDAGLMPARVSEDRNGRDAIDYVDGKRLLLTTTKALNFTRNTDYIEISGVHNSVSTETIPYLMIFSTSLSTTGIRSALGLSSGDDRMAARRLDSDSLVSASFARIDNYRYMSGRNRYDLGDIRLFRNSNQIAINSSLSQGMTEDAASVSISIGARSDGLDTSFLGGKCLNVSAFKSIPSSAFRTAFDNFILESYNLPAT
jgi:hypothetical protein